MLLELMGGIDDIATERQLTSGWSFVILPSTITGQFRSEAQKILPSGITEFHARSFDSTNAAECQAYADFLSVLKRTAENTPAALLACSLNDQTWHTDLKSFVARLVTKTLAPLGVSDKIVLNGAADVAPSLFTLLRLLDSPSLSSAVIRSLDIDKNSETGRFASRTVTINSGSIPAPRLLAVLADAYRKQKFPQSPKIDRSAIAIVDSSNSPLVQAADVLGNFSMNYLIRNLAPTTPGRTMKAQLFGEVFRDLLPHTHFGQLASLNPTKLELELKTAGALTFQVMNA
jgi:hypothetical protein